MKYIWLILALLLTILIFFMSSRTGASSGSLSGAIAREIIAICTAAGVSLTGDVEHTLRKLAHLLEFALLAYFWCKTYSNFGVSVNMSTGYILFICLFTAVLDEFVQLHTPGRTCLITDVLLDFSGAFCSWMMYRIYHWRR